MNSKYIPYIKGEQIRIAVMFQVASFWPSIESFYKACKNDRNFDIRVYFIDESSVEKEQMKTTLRFLEKNQISYEVYNEDLIKSFKPHAALYQPPYDVSYRNPDALSYHIKQMGTRIIYIPYGIEIADTEDARMAHFDTFVVRNSWRIYVISEYMQQEYYEYCSNRHATRALGLPKFDSYVNKTYLLNSEIVEKAHGKKVVLWKMHFPKIIYNHGKRMQVTPYLEEYEKFAKSLKKYKSIYFIVMPHPMFFSETIPRDLTESAKRLIDILSQYENAFIDRSPDYRDSLMNADAIIIDRSALMVEAAVCKVPILYMRNEDYEEPMTRSVQDIISTYYQGCRCEDIVKFVDDFQNNKLYVAADREKILNMTVPYRDGKCGERIKNDILNELFYKEENRKTRLVFFGVGQVCRYYIDYLRIQQDKRFELIALSDNKEDMWGTTYKEIPILSPDELKKIEYDFIIVTTEQYYLQIKKKLVYELHLDDEKIMRLDHFCENIIKWGIVNERI